MADDILSIGSIADVDSPGSAGSTLDTGVLRRKYNFGDRVSELALAQDPFFRFVSQVAKKPTDDPEFKFTERRGSWNKRYAYMDAFSSAANAAPATAPNTNVTPSADDIYTFKFGCDYASQGNLQNVFGQTASYKVGDSGTQPQFFLPDSLVRIPYFNNSGGAQGTVDGYTIWKINTVDLATSGFAILNATCVKGSGVAQQFQDTPAEIDATAGASPSSETLESTRTYVMGSVFGKGTGYPQTWDDQPFSTGYGQTQIWKTSMVMDNTDRATVLKYEGNEWARIWKEKLIEHKWDLEQSLLFGSQSADYRTTQGAVDWINSYGNKFLLDVTVKTQDSFLDDLSAYLDPRYNNAMATVFFCSTAVYNWLHKLSGYFANNIGSVQPGAGGSVTSFPAQTATGGSLGRADMAISGRKKVLGLDTTVISTIYGDMNLVRNIHLDGTNIKMLGINMKHCAYRPLQGNGINRDTSIYVGVQTLENSGVDRRVDQILTEAGMEWSMPEAHAMWT